MIQASDVGMGPAGSVVINGEIAPATPSNVQAAASASGLMPYIFAAPFSIQYRGETLSFRQGQAVPLGPAHVAAFTAAGAAISVLGAVQAVALTPPAGFASRWTPANTNPNLTFSLASGVYTTGFSINSLVPTSFDASYWVDPVNGSDSRSGVSPSLAFKTLGKFTATAAAASAGQNLLCTVVLTADAILLGSQGWNNVQPVANTYVINPTPQFRLICGGSASAAAPAWAANASFAAVYQAPVASGSMGNVIDTIPGARSYAINPSNAASLTNVPPTYATYVQQTSIANVAAAPGSWFYDGSILYVRPVDGRDLTIGANAASMIVGGLTNNIGRAGVGNANIYVQGIDFVGGGTPFLALASSATVTGFLAFNRCSFQASGIRSSGGNGLSVQGPFTAYLYRCLAAYNCADGFNYHGFGSGGITGSTTDSPDWIEIECVSYGNGTTGSTGTSDNATTSHDYCNGIRLNCVYPNSDDHVYVETDAAHSWGMGCVIGPALKIENGGESVASLINSNLFMDGCVAFANAGNFAYATSTANSAIYTRNMVVANINPAGLGVIGSY